MPALTGRRACGSVSATGSAAWYGSLTPDGSGSRARVACNTSQCAFRSRKRGRETANPEPLGPIDSFPGLNAPHAAFRADLLQQLRRTRRNLSSIPNLKLLNWTPIRYGRPRRIVSVHLIRSTFSFQRVKIHAGRARVQAAPHFYFTGPRLLILKKARSPQPIRYMRGLMNSRRPVHVPRSHGDRRGNCPETRKPNRTGLPGRRHGI